MVGRIDFLLVSRSSDKGLKEALRTTYSDTNIELALSFFWAPPLAGASILWGENYCFRYMSPLSCYPFRVIRVPIVLSLRVPFVLSLRVPAVLTVSCTIFGASLQGASPDADGTPLFPFEQTHGTGGLRGRLNQTHDVAVARSSFKAPYSLYVSLCARFTSGAGVGLDHPPVPAMGLPALQVVARSSGGPWCGSPTAVLVVPPGRPTGAPT